MRNERQGNARNNTAHGEVRHAEGQTAASAAGVADIGLYAAGQAEQRVCADSGGKAHSKGRGMRQAAGDGASRRRTKQQQQRKTVPPVRDARTAAWHILEQLEDGISAQEALDTALRVLPLTPLDKGLCTELMYGCLRMENRIAFVLGQVLPRPEKLPRACWLALELAAYAMLFLQKIPHYAVVNWAVEVVNLRWGQGLARVVNGALRSLGRIAEAAENFDFYAEAVTSGGKKAAARAGRVQLARWYSMPQWIVDVWCSAYGEADARALLERSFRRPWPCVRLNGQHADAPLVRGAVEQWAREHADTCLAVGAAGWAFAAGTAPLELAGKPVGAWRDEGALSWQAAGSQLVLAELGCDRWHVPVWDACCGQGGKTMFLLEQGVPVRLSTDMHNGRLGRVRGECRRLHLPEPLVMRADMTRPPVRQWEGNIVLDVPCTGLGTLARRPDIRRHRSFAVLEEMRALQECILDAAWAVLQGGRELAYITCALDPQENEAQIAAFVQRHADAELLREWQTPHSHPWLEGMYGACLCKRAE